MFGTKMGQWFHVRYLGRGGPSNIINDVAEAI